MRLTERAHFRWTAARALAVAFHAGLLGALTWLGHDGDGPADTLASGAPLEVELAPIEVEVAAGLATREMPTDEPATAREPVATWRAPRASPLAPAAGRREESSDAPEVPSREGYALDPRARPTDPSRVDLATGDGDWSRWALPNQNAPAGEGPRPPPRAPRPVSTTGGIAEALEAHDREIGLGPAGGVLTAARDAAHMEVAPALGSALFRVTVLSSGHVEVDLLNASGEVEGWKSVGSLMRAAIAQKPPAIPSSRNGVLIELELRAEEHWPNGAPARSEGPTLAVTPLKFQTFDEAKEALARRNPLAVDPVTTPSDRPPLRLQVEPPGVFLKGRGKVCGYQIGITPFGLGLGGGCDPSNIGAKPIRVVSTKIVREAML